MHEVTYDMLNEQQKEAFKIIVDYVTGEKYTREHICILGYAGTGKTTTISVALHEVRKKMKKMNFAMTAPTNKAVRVLKQSSKMKLRMQFKTIYKLLGLKPKIDTDTGQQTFINDVMEENSIQKIDVLIIDETSMLDDRLFYAVTNFPHLKVIFMGDPAQIPPVNKVDSIPMLPQMREKFNMKTIELTQIMRQNEDNPVVNLAWNIRNNLASWDPIKHLRETKLNEEGIGVHFFKLENKDETRQFRDFVLNHFISVNYEQDSNYCKVIAYTNAMVDAFNKNIRIALFGQQAKQKILNGENLIADSPIIDGGLLLFNTNDEFIVRKLKIEEGVKFKHYVLMVEYIIDNEKQRKEIKVLHEDSEEDFKKYLINIRNLAKAETNKAIKKQLWRKYYDTKSWYAVVKYNYAITAHKSQGSTYDNVFVIEYDIDKNGKIVERNRIKYTAFTRTRFNLFILQK